MSTKSLDAALAALAHLFAALAGFWSANSALEAESADRNGLTATGITR
jgi:hypothetical protein